MSAEKQTREIGPLSVRADVVPGSMNEEERTVEVTWTTGARVKRYSWFDGPWYEELSTDPRHVRMGRLQSGRAPVLLGHNSYNPDAHQGVVVSATIRQGEGVAKLRFAKGDEDADKTWNKIRQGILTSVSVGYSVHKMEKVEETDGVPVMRATDWEPYEISPVSMPADAGAHIRSEGGVERRNLCEIITRGEAPQKEKDMSNEKNPTAPTDAARATPPPVVSPSPDAEQARAQERERVSTIHTLARKHALPEADVERFVHEGTPVDQVRAHVLDTIATRSEKAGGPGQVPSGAAERAHVAAGEDEKDKRLRGMGAWLFERAGAVAIIEQAREHKRFGRQFKDVATDGAEFRGLSLVDLARECLERSGVNTRGMDRMTLVGRAFTHRSGMQTTSDFGVLFENVMYKLMLGAYATAPDSWRRFCGTDTVPDFRASNRYRNGSFGTLDSLSESGEFKNKAVPDGSKYSITTGTKGNIIALTRQAIINDDMGALADLGTRFGRAAGLSIEVDVYANLTANAGLGATMADGKAIFHVDHGNINGTGSALGVDALDADRVVMASQKDPSNNEYLDLRPAVLVVPIGLGGSARVFNNAEYDASVSSKFQVPNKVRGLVRDIVDTPRLTGTRRYLFTDPGIAPVIKVVFLEGSGEAPMLESQDGWRTDGVEWKLRIDYEAQPFDYRGAVTNAGQ